MVGGVGNANDVVVGDVETDLTLGFDLDLRSSKILVSINEVSSSAIELDLFLMTSTVMLLQMVVV